MVEIEVRIPNLYRIPELNHGGNILDVLKQEIMASLYTVVSVTTDIKLLADDPLNPVATVRVVKGERPDQSLTTYPEMLTKLRLIVEHVKKSVKIEEHVRRTRAGIDKNKKAIKAYNTSFGLSDPVPSLVIPETDFNVHRDTSTQKMPDTFEGQADVLKSRLIAQLENQDEDAKKQKLDPVSDKPFVEFTDDLSMFLRICGGRCHLRFFELFCKVPEKDLMERKWLALPPDEREILFNDFLPHLQNFVITALKTVDDYIRRWTNSEFTLLKIIFELGKIQPLFSATALFVGEFFRDSLPLRINPNAEPSSKYYEIGGGSSQQSRIDKEQAKTVSGNQVKRLLREYRNKQSVRNAGQRYIPLVI